MRPEAKVTDLHRTVWYFHGFDPASPARYRRIFAEAAGPEVALGDLPDGAEGWRAVRAEVRTNVRYLRYEELVRRFRDAPPGPVVNRWLWRGQKAIFGYWWDGALGRLMRRAPRAAGLALSPWIVIFGPSILLVPLIGWIGSWFMGFVASLPIFMMALLPRWHLDIVIDLFAYMRMMAQGEGPNWYAYTDRIGEAAREIEWGEDETVVVGHSLGGVAAILAVAHRLETWPRDKEVGLLTLGSTHGIVLAQRGAGRDLLAAAIRTITTDARVFWVDVSSPRDAFCVPLTDPLALIEAPAGQSPRVVSTRLANAPKIPGDKRTVFAAMRRHMGYLLRAEPGSGFDYAEVVTGPTNLRDRFGERGNSPKARMWHG